MTRQQYAGVTAGGFFSSDSDPLKKHVEKMSHDRWELISTLLIPGEPPEILFFWSRA